MEKRFMGVIKIKKTSQTKKWLKMAIRKNERNLGKNELGSSFVLNEILQQKS